MPRLPFPATSGEQHPIVVTDESLRALQQVLRGNSDASSILRDAMKADAGLCDWIAAYVERAPETSEALAEAFFRQTPERLGAVAIALVGQLAEEEAGFAKRLESAKLDAMKELAYGASHEVNNPLANISGRAQTLLRDEKEPRRRRLLEAIDAQALRAHEMISDLMLFARPPALQRSNVDFRTIIQTAAEELRRLAEASRVTLDIPQAENPIEADVDSTQMTVAVKALVQNAIEAIGHDGRVSVELQQNDNTTFVTVADNGPGMSDHVREHLFDPFFSGREAGRGLGFGLSKCWRIVTDHGGTVNVETPAGGGAVFSIEIPSTAARPPEEN